MTAEPAPSPALRVKAYFETLTREQVAALGSIYSDDAFFKDPFNEVRGLPAIQRIFRHMFEQVDQPRFVVHDVLGDRNQAFMTWDFRFRRRGAPQREMLVRGASHLRFAPDGRVVMHRDYWDAAEELYEKIPLLGRLMRWIKRRLSA